MNVEQEMAYTYFKSSLDFDSTLFGSHVMLARMSPAGEVRDMHQKKARELVKGKNENSNLFVSFFDVLPGDDLKARRHKVWSKMYEIEPDGRFIHYYYAITKPTLEEGISELEVLLEKQKNDNNFLGVGHILNRLGYFNDALGNKAKAKNYLDQYIKAYPDGYNPYDSMGDYYSNEKDYENALSYYQKSLDRYPANRSSIKNIREINDLKADKEESAAKQKNQDTFDRNVSTIKTWIKGFADKDLEAQISLYADTAKWSPPDYNGNVMVGLKGIRDILSFYHNNFDDITFQEGVGLPDDDGSGFYAGSYYPDLDNPNAVRVYGTWTPTHKETGKKVSNKWYGLIIFNEDGKISYFSDWFDVNGIQVQIEAE
jgi:tetratricopeptide (TPR) repeat protein